jgi:tetratricopeptide (TPR) repeat protein
VRELQQDVVSRGGVVLIGNCYEETQTIPYYPFRDAFKQYFEVNKEEAVSIFKKLPGYSQWELKQIIPSLSIGSSRLGGTSLLPKFERSPDKYRLYESFRLFFENVSARFGLFIVEDLHWSDEASLDLLHYLSRNFRETLPKAGHNPKLLLGTYRTEEAESNQGIGKLTSVLNKENLTEEIKLLPLPRDEVSTLLNQLTSGVEHSKQFQDDLFGKTEGNPFFVEELLRSLYVEGKSDHVGAIHELPLRKIPQSIQTILKRRVDSLSPEMKEVLTCCSLVGEEFDFEVLRRVLKKSDEEILDAVEGGVREHFVREFALPESRTVGRVSRLSERYRFIHSLMSDVLYSGIGKVKRRILHGKVGEALEEVYIGKLEVLNGQLSYHFERGEKWEKAVNYALKSAKHAKEVYANQEAIRMYEKAREILPRLKIGSESGQDEDGSIAEGLGDVYQVTGEYEKALKEYDLMMKVTKRIRDEKNEGKALRKIGSIYDYQGNFDKSMKYGKKSYEIHQKTGDKKGLAESLNHIAIVHWNHGDFEESLKCLEESLTIFREIGDNFNVSNIINNIGVIHWNRGEYRNALKCHKDALKIRIKIGNKIAVAKDLNNIGIVHSSLGNYSEALKCYEESLTITRDVGDKRTVTLNLNSIGVDHWNHGDYREALQCFEESLTFQREIGEKKAMALSLTNIGVIHLNCGDHRKAKKCIEESLTITKEIGDKKGVALSLSKMGILHQHLFDLEKALKYHNESLDLMEKLGIKVINVNLLKAIGTTYYLSGNNEKALQNLNQALEIVVKSGLIENEQGVLSILSEIWLSKGDYAQSSKYCERLLRIARKKELKGYLAIGRKIKGEILTAVAVARIRQASSSSSKKAKELKAAEKELKEALKIAEKIGAKPQLWQIHASLGKVYTVSDGKGSKKKSSEQFAKAKEIIQDIASTIDNEKLKKTFLNAKPVKAVISM